MKTDLLTVLASPKLLTSVPAHDPQTTSPSIPRGSYAPAHNQVDRGYNYSSDNITLTLYNIRTNEARLQRPNPCSLCATISARSSIHIVLANKQRRLPSSAVGSCMALGITWSMLVEPSFTTHMNHPPSNRRMSNTMKTIKQTMIMMGGILAV